MKKKIKNDNKNKMVPVIQWILWAIFTALSLGLTSHFMNVLGLPISYFVN